MCPLVVNVLSHVWREGKQVRLGIMIGWLSGCFGYIYIYVNLYALEHAYHDMRWRPSHVTILAQGPLSLAHSSPRRLRNGKVSAPLAFDRDGVL